MTTSTAGLRLASNALKNDAARNAAARNAAARNVSIRCRAIASTSQRPASVSSPPDDLIPGKGNSEGTAESSKISGSTEARSYPGLSPTERKVVIDTKRELKFKQYEKMLLEKAKQEGFSSVEELRLKQEEKKATAGVAETEPFKGAGMPSEAPSAMSGLTEEDAKVASEIRARVEAEAKRKMETGQVGSGPGIKTLADILDVDKVRGDPSSKIAELWTGYHTLKNKLSAVIPASTYARMISKARAYPQFILPLPRTIVGSLENQEETANVAPGEAKQGFEMQYLEWGFLPHSKPIEDTSGQKTETSQEDLEVVSRAPPSTVLFTPLAEYKLRNEYAQPVLVLTHYTDLAASKGIVLMRGEVTGREEAQAAPTGVAAAAAAAAAGESEEVQEKLKAPLKSQGKMTQQDAQLLTVTLQRFFMENKEAPIPGAEDRQELLEAFHRDQSKFDVDRLCKVSFAT